MKKNRKRYHYKKRGKENIVHTNFIFYRSLKILIIVLFVLYLIFLVKSKKIKLKTNEINFEYHNYERELITERMKNISGWELYGNEPYFINGIIRKFKPKKCLEIGVSRGGSSILILNAIKDIENSFLFSMDINNRFYKNPKLEVGYNAKLFPELLDKWKLLTGKQPHQFLEELNIKFDFLFLDTVHSTPGELINIIEVFPFLEENAIVILHDITFHIIRKSKEKFHPSNIYLFSELIGEKIIISNKEQGIENIGGILLSPNQYKYYKNYFLLLFSPWQYFPEEKHIQELEYFINKYYKKKIYLYLFQKAVKLNRIYLNKFKK